MADLSQELASSSPPSQWTKWLLQYAPRLPKFRFMIHDRWANVLFLHWRVPSHLEATLKAHTEPFVLDQYDGSAWIGLILLTEENVGPSIGRSQWTCLTHHGINVRTYVRGVDASGDDSGNGTSVGMPQTTTRGIHFSSLECDDEFTSFGANFFGMPYRVAEMTRSYSSSGYEPDGNETVTENRPTGCQPSSQRRHYRIRSERLSSARPSLARVLFHTALNWWRPRVLHSTITDSDNRNQSRKTDENELRDGSPQDSSKTNDKESSFPSPRFSVGCTWSRCSGSETTTPTPKDTHNGNHSSEASPRVEPFGKWAAERYFVYTHKYGRNWRGQVDHEPWPLQEEEKATHEHSKGLQLHHLDISGIETYEPSSMRPILRYMADHRPDAVGFSPGVGPVTFTMLQPV